MHDHRQKDYADQEARLIERKGGIKLTVKYNWDNIERSECIIFQNKVKELLSND